MSCPVVCAAAVAFADADAADRAVAGFREATALVDVSTEAGPLGPIVRLLHESTCSASEWEPLVVGLSALAVDATFGSTLGAFQLDGWHVEARRARPETKLRTPDVSYVDYLGRVRGERVRHGVERLDDRLRRALGHREDFHAFVPRLPDADLRACMRLIEAQDQASHSFEGRTLREPAIVGDLEADDFDVLAQRVGDRVRCLCSVSQPVATSGFRRRCIDALATWGADGRDVDAITEVVAFAVLSDEPEVREHAIPRAQALDVAVVAEKLGQYLRAPSSYEHDVMCRAALVLAGLPPHPMVAEVARAGLRRRVRRPEYAAALRNALGAH